MASLPLLLLALAAGQEEPAADETSRLPWMACKGTAIIKADTWKHTKILVDKWPDIDLPHSRVVRKLLWAITHNNALEEHAQDCAFALATVMLVSLRSLDYDDGPHEARLAYGYLQNILLPRLAPYTEDAALEQWAPDLGDLKIYPSLLGLNPQHSCYGTNLRIFVYSLPELTRGVLHCHHGQWGLEALIPNWLRSGSCVTDHPEEADFFLVPWHTWCQRIVNKMNQTRREISAVYIDLINRKEEALPHWSKNAGRDHLFIFSDQGMNFFPEWRDYIPHSVFAVTEALTPKCGPSCFNPWKDFVIPGHTDYFRHRRMMQYNLPSERRELLFNFHGRHPGLNELYKENKVRGKIMEVFSDLPGVSVGGFTDDYFERMGMSHFCLVPIGTSSWTNHLYEAFFAGCIPVILSDNFKVPFENILDWPSFSVKWPMTDVSMDLYNFLMHTPVAVLREMKAAVDAHACWFDWHQTLEPSDRECSPYLGILRELERKRTVLPQSPGPFWRHQI